MAKIKKDKRLFNGNIHNDIIQLWKSLEMPFIKKESGYTLELIPETGKSIYFMQNVLSKKAFVAGGKVKKDILNCGLPMPFLQPKDLVYNNVADVNRVHEASNRRTNKEKICYCLDLKSAYATALFNYGAITADTINYLSVIEKKDRLAALGMLASNKRIYYYNGFDDLPYKIEHEKSLLTEWFFLCIYETQKIMLHLKQILGERFLFFWVDGIYFTDLDKLNEMEFYLKEMKFNFTVETLRNFTTIKNENSINVYYINEKNKEKIFTLPKPDKYTAAKELIKVLNLHKEENSIISQITKTK